MLTANSRITSQNSKIGKLAAKITENNETIYLLALRAYYRDNYKCGVSDESFVIWVQNKLGMFSE